MSLGADGAQTSADGATFPPAVSEATGPSPPPKSRSKSTSQVQLQVPNPGPGPVLKQSKTVLQELNGSGGAYTQRSV